MVLRLALAILALAAMGQHGWAMQFSHGTSGGGTSYVVARGEIHPGDAAALKRLLARLPGGKPPAALLLDSPGGNVLAGSELAELIHEAALPVVVASSGKCASACFLLLAASPQRIAGANALVGVHSASMNGRETAGSLAVTTVMAREAGRYGVPPAILGKMVQATPGRMEWLTHDDLASMGVRVLGDGEEPGTAIPASASRPASAAPEATVAQFQGALFCGSVAALVSLRVVAMDQASPGRAVLTFGPATTLPAAPSGTFAVEGRLDVSGGVIDLRPTVWMSARPVEFDMLGLSGQSSDGGRTFIGRTTASPACTNFTLRRVG